MCVIQINKQTKNKQNKAKQKQKQKRKKKKNIIIKKEKKRQPEWRRCRESNLGHLDYQSNVQSTTPHRLVIK